MDDFPSRHIGPNNSDQRVMLDLLGYDSVEELVAAASPARIRQDAIGNLPSALSEVEVLADLRRLANMNQQPLNFIGQGYYGTHLPTVIQRNVLENPAWYTAYTPYQPEISQGRLEAMLNFQTMVTDLTGLDLAGASLLDEATAAAEAMTLLLRASRSDSKVVLVDHDTHPQTLAVLQTRATPLDIMVQVIDLDAVNELPAAFGLIVSYPGSSGRVRPMADIADRAHAAGILVAAATDPLSLVLLEPPASWGADAAFGSAQRFGVPMAFGGPHAGYLAVRKGLERNLPGRLVGVSVDVHGAPAYRLALQTREQHIRREKATSNICTAQALLAVIAAMYASYHGWGGLTAIAERTRGYALRFADALRAAGLELLSDDFFDTVTFKVADAANLKAQLDSQLINLRLYSADMLSAAFDETTDEAGFAALLAALGVSPAAEGPRSLPAGCQRREAALSHPVFNSYHSETEMMRYLRRLADFDLALDRTMIPLGSCTMKLNAATEMAAITWPEFAQCHPYAPESQNQGWLQIIADLEDYLAEVTGYDRVSIQPNAGSQGEFAGLLAVAAYHRSRGEGHRNICLIPSSAHGTNAASAVMAGMKVVVVGCDDAGNVDLADLKAKIAEHASNLAAIMITYPSTHGVYEETISDICALVHEAGGQVYVDGANLNALIGVARPGKFGADVSHLNLHKTFSIPHGGGGPGVGPVGVRAHLAPFLPGDPLNPEATVVGPVSAAKYGSAGVLPIPYAYIRMMGMDGLKSATEVAVLSANYLARKLGERYPVLYTNEHGLVAHECILDLREITRLSGVSVDDVAKRLIDFGFHAPTMSFPVAGTLMVEPTESESLAELDRFIQAMDAIADEIAAVQGGADYQTSALATAPHTAASLLNSDRTTAERMAAAFPAGVNQRSKYWPPVGRIDGAYGDRNLVCTCPRPEDLAD